MAMNLVVLVVVLVVLVGVLVVEERRTTIKTMNTTSTTNSTNTTAQHKYKSITPYHTVTLKQLSPSPPPILFDYGYGCEGGGRLLVVVVTY